MTSVEEAKLAMYNAVNTQCKAHPAIVSKIKAFNDAVAALSATITGIDAAIQLEDLVIIGITADKNATKKRLCQLAHGIAAPTFAFASTIGNNKLREEVDYSLTDFRKTKDEALIPRARNIHDRALQHKTDLADFGITDAQLAQLIAAITDYENILATPRNAVTARKTVRLNLKALFKQADAILKDRMDKVVIGLKTTDPDFLSSYKSNRDIVDQPKTRTTFKGLVTSSETNEPIADARVIIVELKTELPTNQKGRFIFRPITFGTYTILVEAEKYATQTFHELTIKKGEITKLKIALSPKPIIPPSNSDSSVSLQSDQKQTATFHSPVP